MYVIKASFPDDEDLAFLVRQRLPLKRRDTERREHGKRVFRYRRPVWQQIATKKGFDIIGGGEMRIAYGYLRVSTLDQAENGISLDSQDDRIQAWCEANEYRLAGVFRDAGISGKRAANRPGLQEALDAVCKTRGAVLVVYSLSRLARSTKDALAIAERLDKAGADLVSLSEKIDTTSAAGKMIFRLMAVLAEFERDLVSERTSTAMAHLRSQGRKISRHCPFGFRPSADGQSLERDAQEQGAIEIVMEGHRRGQSLRDISGDLAARGIMSRAGTPISATTVASIIRRAG